MSIIYGMLVFTLSFYVIGLSQEVSFLGGVSTSAVKHLQKRHERREDRQIAKILEKQQNEQK